MNNYGFYKLKINETYRTLIPPLSCDEYLQLEENIVNEGCREPIIIWDNVIVDGHNRYQICTEWELPFRTQEITFASEEEAIKWICANQLGRRNISEETRKYLIGKKYEAEKVIGARNITGNNQYKLSSAKVSSVSNKTAHRIGDEYHISHNTVYKYGTYANAMDNISKKDKDIAQKILSGEMRISHENVLELSHLPNEDLKKLKGLFTNPDMKHISFNDIKHELHWKRQSSTKHTSRSDTKGKTCPIAEIKQMPAFDPDAELSSLTLTIPSWVSSITRAFSASDMTLITPRAAAKLKHQLIDLRNTISTYLETMTEDNKNHE